MPSPWIYSIYPVIGRLRFFFEDLGEYFRQYFFAGDRAEMPFNRATRAWVYKEAKELAQSVKAFERRCRSWKRCRGWLTHCCRQT